MKNRNENAFTGLEAAIVLIAFVVVAAVFSYVVLGAGFFTTQKSQQVVHAGVTQAASNIVVKGNVYGIDGAMGTKTPATVGLIQFDLGLAAGGLPVDVTKIQMVFSTANSTPYTIPYSSDRNWHHYRSKWNVTGRSPGANDLIQEGQYFTVLLSPQD